MRTNVKETLGEITGSRRDRTSQREVLSSAASVRGTRSPIRRLTAMVVAIFGAEVLVMALLHLLPGLTPVAEAMIDGLLVAGLTLPVGYFLLYRPLARENLQRRRAEEESGLKAKLLDAASDSIVLHDCDGKLVYANETACRARGYTREEMMGLNLKNLAAPGEARSIDDRLETLARAGETTFESVGKRKDGGLIPLEVDATTVPADGTNLVLSIDRDISERISTQAALQKSEEKYRSIFNTAADLIMTVSREGTVIDCNPRAYSILGYMPEEMVGRCMPDIVHPDYRDKARESLAETLTIGFTYGRQYKLVRKNGSVIDVAIDSSGLTNGDGSYDTAICIIRDITFSRRMEEAIKLAYAELERVFNASGDGMRVIDTNFNVLRVNKAHTLLSGVSKTEAVTRKCYEDFYGQQCHTSRCTLARILDGEEYVESEVEKERGDGTRVSCVLTATPLLGPDDKLVGIVETLKDITELKRTREQLQHSQLLASLGEMTAGIAHEVNNPLGSILLYSELLIASELPPEAKQDLGVIHDEAKRAAGIMSDLLTYSRRGKPQVRRLDLHRLLRRLIKMRRYQATVQNILVRREMARGPLYVTGDSSQLAQVFMNLMLNAEEALRLQGGGTITVSTQTQRDWVKITIADDGAGIPPENLQQVFYPFFTTKTTGEGTGLGLSACYGIVTDHQGLTYAENNEMGGATFTVELPLSPPQRQARDVNGRKKTALATR